MKRLVLLLLACAAAAVFAAGKQEAGSPAQAHPRARQANRLGWTLPSERVVIAFLEAQDNPETVPIRQRVTDIGITIGSARRWREPKGHTWTT